jgi:hypothetical protein
LRPACTYIYVPVAYIAFQLTSARSFSVLLHGLHQTHSPRGLTCGTQALTARSLSVPVQRAVPHDPEFRKLLGAVVVIAANAGGAWTPIGDVTTTVRMAPDHTAGAVQEQTAWHG